jgi:hypothetical protein
VENILSELLLFVGNKSGSLSQEVIPGSSMDVVRFWVILSKLNLFAKSADAEKVFLSRWFS